MADAASSTCNDHPARDADMDRQGAACDIPGLPNLLLNFDRCLYRSFRVVAMGYRRAENGHHAIAYMFVDRASVALNDRIHRLEKVPEQRMDFFGIEFAAEL